VSPFLSCAPPQGLGASRLPPGARTHSPQEDHPADRWDAFRREPELRHPARQADARIWAAGVAQPREPWQPCV